MRLDWYAWGWCLQVWRRCDRCRRRCRGWLYGGCGLRISLQSRKARGVYHCPLGGELNVVLYRDGAFLGPVNAVGVWAVLIKTNPSCDRCPRIQLGSRGIVDPNMLPPFRHACKIGLVPGEPFKQCGGPAYSPGGCPVLQPNCHSLVAATGYSDLHFLYRTAGFFLSIGDLISSHLPIVVARYFFTLLAPSPSFLLLPSPSGTFCSRSLYVPLPSGSFCMLPMCSG